MVIDHHSKLNYQGIFLKGFYKIEKNITMVIEYRSKKLPRYSVTVVNCFLTQGPGNFVYLKIIKFQF